MSRSNLLGLDFATFAAWLRAAVGHETRHHAAAYRALMQTGRWEPSQVSVWVEAEQSRPGLLAQLTKLAEVQQSPTATRQLRAEDAEQGATIKHLLRLADGAEVETVVIPMAGGTEHTICVSSQVGCRMGCGFCQTARMGLVRQLTAGEIVAQVVAAVADLGRAPRNVVFMGMGEPLDNVEAVAQAVRVLSERRGLAIPERRITVSTVGRVDVFPRLAELGLLRSNLAVSLTSANDAQRSRLMPVNRQWNLATLKAALLALPLPPKRKIMISCAVIAGVNDSIEQCDELREWVAGLPVLVNLIPCNPIPGSEWRRPDDDTLLAFRAHLEAAGIEVRMRLTKGDSVMAACGQLGDPARGRAQRRSATLTMGPESQM
jgi:23S rRNA (adenine2503-C2)-methyltransferase